MLTGSKKQCSTTEFLRRTQAVTAVGKRSQRLETRPSTTAPCAAWVATVWVFTSFGCLLCFSLLFLMLWCVCGAAIFSSETRFHFGSFFY